MHFGLVLTRLAVLCRADLALLALLFAFAVPSPSALGQQPAGRDLKAVREAGVLRVAITRFDLPAFHWHANGELTGPEITLAHQIATALGVQAAFIADAASFDAVVDAVAAGRADIGISKLSQTYYRLLHVRFSDPYITLRHALLFSRAAVAARADGRSPDDVLRQFIGRIGVIRGSAYADFARRNFPGAIVVDLPNWEAAVAGLVDGKVDAIYRDEFEIRRVLKLRPALNVHFGTAVVTDQKALLSVALCDTCAKMQELVNFHLTQTQGAFTLQGLLSDDAHE